MADYSGLGKGQSYQEIVTGGQRYPAWTRDAFDPVAAASVRQVGPRPISIVANPNYMDESSGASSSAFDPRSSLIPWVLGALAIGLIWLHVVHF